MSVRGEANGRAQATASNDPSPRRGAGRPRDGAVDAALLGATQDLLAEVGYDRVSLDAVAGRAGTGKATIYRRWAGKTELVVAAVEQLYVAPPVPETGSLREDLLACGRTYLGRDDRAQRVLTGLLTEMVRNEPLRTAAHQAVGAPFARLFQTVLTRAQRGGEIDPDADVGIIAAIFPALAFHRVAVEGRPVDEDLLLRIVDHCLLPLVHRRHESHRRQA